MPPGNVHDLYRNQRDLRYAKVINEEHDRQDLQGQTVLGTLKRSMSSPLATSRSTARSQVSVPVLTAEDFKEMGVGWTPPKQPTRGQLNSTWTPHPIFSRGTLNMSKPEMLTRSLDPMKMRAQVCEEWEGPRDRFERNAKILQGTTRRTPRQADYWRFQDTPSSEKPFKPGHAWPVKSPQGGVGFDLRAPRLPGDHLEEQRHRGQGPFWPPQQANPPTIPRSPI
eukprot:TRINITY_DN31222_c0_g1_i1.p1 TRINITY_DN31222_c0_g1~~TRINITY_DN31222_c0_g1_i1.p1  ORF type:complete len:224 (+),score=22.62 TRINITY_DN31222_c0_g1_i1:119-790(+)